MINNYYNKYSYRAQSFMWQQSLIFEFIGHRWGVIHRWYPSYGGGISEIFIAVKGSNRINVNVCLFPLKPCESTD